jgi:hypothetical protein
VVAFDNGLYHLIRTGTCASGGPYVSARPCPPGTGLHVVSLVGGVFAGLIGTVIYATRGDRGRPSPVPLGAIMWALLFCTIAGVALLAAFGPANPDEDGLRVMAIVFGVVFIPMGLAPVALAGLGRTKSAEKAALVATGKRCRGVVVSVEDTGLTINDDPHVKITVRAEPPGEPPFTIVRNATVSRVSIPRAGDVCTVFYDPAARETKNGITFDPVPGMPSTPAPAQTAAAEPDPASPSPPPETLIDKLERLGELRASGVLTEAEFEQQKKKLLGG